MLLDSLLIKNVVHRRLCKALFKVLHCNLLWVIKLDNNSLKLLVTDKFLLEHYWNKKYYLQDPSLQKPDKNDNPNHSTSWKVTLGTECSAFKNTGFLYDLYKLFGIEEFVSVEKKMDSEVYCFRFFTRNNRYVFMNRILNNLPIIKYFINAMIEKFKLDLSQQPTIKIAGLK